MFLYIQSLIMIERADFVTDWTPKMIVKLHKNGIIHSS